MPVEAATSIATLDPNSPAGGEGQNDGDNHIRLIKAILQAIFPNASVPFRFPTSVAAKVADYNVAAPADQNLTIPVSASTANRTVNLPAMSAALDGFSVTVFKSDASGNIVTIDGNGGDTINGATTQTLTYQFDAMTLIWCQTFGQWIGFRQGVSLVPSFTSVELGGPGITDTTLARSAAGLATLEGVLIMLASHVVNDLTTGGVAVPLSAAQGVAIKAITDALSSTLTALSATVTALSASTTASLALKKAIGTDTASGATDLPMGHFLWVVQDDAPSLPARNAVCVPHLHNSINTMYVLAGASVAGTVLAGTWRCRGTNGSGLLLAERVAS